MGLRSFMSDRPVLATIASALLLIPAAWFAKGALTSRRQLPQETYFYDIASGEIVALPKSTPSPAMLENGKGPAFRAYVFSCGECTPKKWNVLFLVSEPAGRRNDEDPRAPIAQQKVASPPETKGQEPHWLSSDNPEANQLTARYMKMCNGKKAVLCQP